MSRFLQSKYVRMANFMEGAHQRGRNARDRGEPVTACKEHPMSPGCIAAWERGWYARDRELFDAAAGQHSNDKAD